MRPAVGAQAEAFGHTLVIIAGQDFPLRGGVGIATDHLIDYRTAKGPRRHRRKVEEHNPGLHGHFPGSCGLRTFLPKRDVRLHQLA